MSDGASRSEHQRARGVLRVSVKLRDGITAIDRLRQEGCLKARFPRPVDWMEIVTLNSSGGVAAGDVLDSAFVVGPGARVTIVAQAAERFYRAASGDHPSLLRTSIRVAEAAHAEWLPQETILYDGCAVDRGLDVEVAEGGSFLGLESFVFGRTAMGETLRRGSLADTIRLKRGGALLLHDAIRLDGAIAEKLARPAIGGGHCALATIFYLAGDTAERLDAVRAALDGYEAGASAWNGMLIARILAADGASLRRATIAALRALRDGRTLPRVWAC